MHLTPISIVDKRDNRFNEQSRVVDLHMRLVRPIRIRRAHLSIPVNAHTLAIAHKLCQKDFGHFASDFFFAAALSFTVWRTGILSQRVFLHPSVRLSL